MILGILGIVISVGAAFFVWYIQKVAQDKMDKFTKDALKLIQDRMNSSIDLIVGIRNSDLMHFWQFYEDKDEGRAKYFHYKLRFETYDNLGLTLKDSNESVDVKILGTTSNALNNNLEHNTYEYYICRVKSSKSNLFSKDEKASCFFFNGKSYISKNVCDIIEPEDKYEFTISTLGNVQTSTVGETPAIEIDPYPRAKDHRLIEEQIQQ